MWRGGVQKRRETSTNDVSGGQHLVAVAVDGDRSSQHALKWAADHILSAGQIFALLHVRQKATTIPTPTGHQVSISDLEEEVASAFLEQMDLQTKELLLPFQCFCSRRGLQCKEVILDDVDIPKAIVDFVTHQTVDKLILGTSSRNFFARTFKQTDVPTSVSKFAPEFCTVYVISKGKISSIRPAIRPNQHTSGRPAHAFETAAGQFLSIKSAPDARNDIEAPGRSSLVYHARDAVGSGSRSSFSSYDKRIGEKIGRVSQAGGHLDFSYPSIASCPSPSRRSMDQSNNYFPREFLDHGRQRRHLSNMSNEHTYFDGQRKSFEPYGADDANWSSGSGSSESEHFSTILKEEATTSWANNTMVDLESEMRRLKLQLMLEMDMHDDAPPEAHYGKADVELRMGERRLVVEDTTLEMAEMEKQRSKGMLEAAIRAQETVKTEATEAVIREKNLLLDVPEKTKVLDGFSSDARYRRYSFEEIQRATDNFSDSLKIGEGGYGPVFKSTLDHTLVAIKILRSDPTQGMKQFHQEVEVLSWIEHPNMVLLVGACPEHGCLVYEFMANGSLEDRLFCRSGTSPLSWQVRFKVATEIATGLHFLHEIKPEPIVHRDLKPSNILLDRNYVSKIADVGLARLIPPAASDSVTQYRMTAAAGTFCYIDPEYQKTGMLGIKSDVYALGIILLQIITAQPPMGLTQKLETAIETGNLKKMLDPNVPDWPMEETLKFAELALKCTELRRKDRPDLGSVVLPELNQLRALALSTEEAPQDHFRPRSKSYKETSTGHPMDMSISRR